MTQEEAIEALEEYTAILFDKWGYSTEKYKGRYLRFVGQFLEISDNNFDRWANSVEYEIDYSRMKKKRFLRDFDYFTEIS